MENKAKGKPRVHFGALDEQENAKRLRVNEAGVPTLAPGGIDLDALGIYLKESSMEKGTY